MNKKLINLILCSIFIVALLVTLFPTCSLEAKSVKLNKTKITLNIGESKVLKLKNNKKRVRWSSNKKKVATVTQRGMVTARQKGIAIITAKIGKKKYKCTVIVKKRKSSQSASSSAPTSAPDSTEPNTQNIINLTNVDSEKFIKETGKVKDSFANEYTNCYVADTLNDTYVVLYLAKKYSSLNLTIAPTEDRHSKTITYTQIYADNTLVYTSEDITKTTKPINVNLSIENIDTLKIVEVRTSVGDYDKPTLYAGYVSK
ncbi:MAG: Ig-like domain-containing protein [Roseburia sp.]|nr:Ig-like domain-containing protein [Roseburia sp.]